ncbi:MAG: helix-hairpin-helix domain-containing protein [Burkholderiales bacterium]|nr:helix-hairpin-helix domain-containing protein [Burkholderiales bacterium]
MQRSIISSAFIAAALLLCASPSFAADSTTGPGAETKAISKGKASNDKAAKANKAKARAKPVDINSAGKAELKKLPGIKDADADKIIAGRPYLSKADLLTENIVSPGSYDALKSRVIAKQNAASAAKLEKLKKAGASR